MLKIRDEDPNFFQGSGSGSAEEKNPDPAQQKKFGSDLNSK